MSEFLSRTQRQARMNHVCSICGNIIRKGAEYIAIRGRCKNGYWYEHQHIHCDAVICAYEKSTGSEVEYGRYEPVREWLYKNGCEGCPSELKCHANYGKRVFGCKNALLEVLLMTHSNAAFRSIDFMVCGE